jgi:hypothetical protein
MYSSDAVSAWLQLPVVLSQEAQCAGLQRAVSWKLPFQAMEAAAALAFVLLLAAGTAGEQQHCTACLMHCFKCSNAPAQACWQACCYSSTVACTLNDVCMLWGHQLHTPKQQLPAPGS